MILPNPWYTQVSQLLYSVDSSVECNTTTAEQEGFCELSNDCSSYAQFENYFFKIQFKDSQNYMRVPLMTFAETTIEQKCNLYLTSVLGGGSGDDALVGSMYYREFFAVFTNTYDQFGVPTQTTE